MHTSVISRDYCSGTYDDCVMLHCGHIVLCANDRFDLLLDYSGTVLCAVFLLVLTYYRSTTELCCAVLVSVNLITV